MPTTFRCTVIDEDGRRGVREIAARDREHAHLLALIDGAKPLAIVPVAPSLAQQGWDLLNGSDPEQFFIDLAAVIRTGSTAREAVAGFAGRDGRSRRGDGFRAVQARLAEGHAWASSLRTELALPRWIDAALELEPRRGEDRQITVIAATSDILSARVRDVGARMPESIAFVLATLVVLAATGPLGKLVAGLTSAGLVYALTTSGPIGRALAKLRLARFLTIVSALLELGASPRQAVALTADEVGDIRTGTALREAAAAAPETVPLDRLLAVAIDLPDVAALMLASDLLPAEASARASGAIHARAVRVTQRARALASASAVLVLGAVSVLVLGG